MIYFQVRDSNNNVLDKFKTMSEAVKLAKRLRNERKETMYIYDNRPYKKTSNFYEYGYHLNATFCYEKRFFIKIDDNDWEQISVKTEVQLNNVVESIKKYNSKVKKY